MKAITLVSKPLKIHTDYFSFSKVMPVALGTLYYYNAHMVYNMVILDGLQFMICAASTTEQSYKIIGEILSKWWNIRLQTAWGTLLCTTQWGIQNLYNKDMGGRLKPSCYQLKFQYVQSNFFTNTMFSNIEFLQKNQFGQIFINNLAFVKFYSMQKLNEVCQVLTHFYHKVGIPQSSSQ